MDSESAAGSDGLQLDTSWSTTTSSVEADDDDCSDQDDENFVMEESDCDDEEVPAKAKKMVTSNKEKVCHQLTSSDSTPTNTDPLATKTSPWILSLSGTGASSAKAHYWCHNICKTKGHSIINIRISRSCSARYARALGNRPKRTVSTLCQSAFPRY